MYDHTFYKQVQISRSDIRPHTKWAVSLVILHMVTSIFLRALSGYIWVKIIRVEGRGYVNLGSGRIGEGEVGVQTQQTKSDALDCRTKSYNPPNAIGSASLPIQIRKIGMLKANKFSALLKTYRMQSSMTGITKRTCYGENYSYRHPFCSDHCASCSPSYSRITPATGSLGIKPGY